MAETKAPPDLRAKHLKEKIRMRDVLEHFGHRFRIHGNMFCPWHPEKNPSARLYDDQDTVWCWVCSPDHGVDIIEFVIIELNLEQELPSYVNDSKRHGYATLRALDYLEEEFNLSYEGQGWQNRALAGLSALRTTATSYNPATYWRSRHSQLLQVLAHTSSGQKWEVYDRNLPRLRSVAAEDRLKQSAVFDQVSAEIASLEEESVAAL